MNTLLHIDTAGPNALIGISQDLKVIASKQNNLSNTFSIVEIRKKLEYYCAYQDRCHQEVYQKMFSFL